MVVQAQQMSEFLLPMLEFAPSQRATAAQALRHPWLAEVSPPPPAAAAATSAQPHHQDADAPVGGSPADASAANGIRRSSR